MSRGFKVTAHMWEILPADHPDQTSGPGGFWGCRRGLPGVEGGGVAPHPTAASVRESLQPTKPLGDL